MHHQNDYSSVKLNLCATKFYNRIILENKNVIDVYVKIDTIFYSIVGVLKGYAFLRS